ncbi:MAG: response regulator [Desulfatibacillum sp.]|nr:response regulator [Desulfatibacillum sp.]
MSDLLIVDDNEQNRYFLDALLKGHGFETLSAENGRQALELAAANPPALVITDLLMPEMDGFELCRRWKSDPVLKHIPFVVYTATYTEPQDEKLALSLGADRFLIKPMEPDLIVGVIREMLEKVREKQPPGNPHLDDIPQEFHKEYSQVVARKLDKKVRQLEAEIKEKQKVEKALRESEERFRMVAEATTDLIYEWEPDSDAVKWFGDIDNALGFAHGEFPPTVRAWTKQIHGDDQKKLFALKNTPVQEAGPILDQYRIAMADGSWRHWVDKVVPADTGEGRVTRWIGACVDITAQKNLEAQLYQAQKMEAVGQIAGGLAHDFNNLIQVIMGYSDLILWDSQLTPQQKEHFEQVHKAAQKASAMTRQLLAFSRRQVIRPMYLALNDLISDLHKMVQRLMGEQVQVEWRPYDNLGTIHADPGQIDQVLINLCVNARDAMNAHGAMTISTTNIDLDQDFCAMNLWAKPGKYVMLAVEDSGCGMDAKTMEDIFQPFYTTKETGKGTGLGLSTVYGIVKQHEGLIQVTSKPGCGATFRIFFPRVESRAQSLGKYIPGDRLGGSETILVAEDQEMLLDLTQHILEREGYKVLNACNGQEAISIARASKDSIDLAILDMVMPLVGGKEAMEEISRINPAIKFLFTSGYSQDGIHINFVLQQGLHLINKPYPSEQLLQKVRDILDNG